MSILCIVFELGFIFVVMPDDFIGFIRLSDDGSVVERLPCYVDPGTGLIMIDFVVTPSEDQNDMVCKGGVSDEIRLVDRRSTSGLSLLMSGSLNLKRMWCVMGVV